MRLPRVDPGRGGPGAGPADPAKRRNAIAAIVGVGAWLAGCDAPRAPDDPLQRWPELPVLDLADRPATLPATSGHPRIINLWALWCAPCRRELPGLQRLALTLAPGATEVCTVALADDGFAVREYLRQHASNLQGVLLPPRTPVVQELGLAVLPQTFVVAADGRVLVRWRGAREWDSPALRDELDRLLRSG